MVGLNRPFLLKELKRIQLIGFWNTFLSKCYWIQIITPHRKDPQTRSIGKSGFFTLMKGTLSGCLEQRERQRPSLSATDSLSLSSSWIEATGGHSVPVNVLKIQEQKVTSWDLLFTCTVLLNGEKILLLSRCYRNIMVFTVSALCVCKIGCASFSTQRICYRLPLGVYLWAGDSYIYKPLSLCFKPWHSLMVGYMYCSHEFSQPQLMSAAFSAGFQ